MRTLNFIPLLVLIVAAAYPASASRVSMLDARKSLIEYAIQFEARGQVSVAKADYRDWLKSLSFTSEAKAYANGETCLVLGFKSTFQNGLCRLSTAEGAEKYKSACSEGSLPCNPAVFGQSDADHVFCAPASAGNQLSKACAYQTFQYLNTKSDGGIAGLASMSAASFDLSKLSFKPGNEKLQQVAATLFSGDASLQAAHEFVNQLCQDIATGKKTGNQPQDLKTCLYYSKFLNATKVSGAKDDQADDQQPAATSGSPKVEVKNAQPTITPTITPAATPLKAGSPAPTATAVPSVSPVPTVSNAAACCTLNRVTGAIPTQTNSQVTQIVKQLDNSSKPCQSAFNPFVESLGMGTFDHPSAGSRQWTNSGGETLLGYYGPFTPKAKAYAEEHAPPREVFNAHNKSELELALKKAGLKESPREAVGEVARYNPAKFSPPRPSVAINAFARSGEGNGFPMTKQYLMEVILTKDCKLDRANFALDGSDENVSLNRDLCLKINALPSPSASAVKSLVGEVGAVTVQEVIRACGPNGSLVKLLK